MKLYATCFRAASVQTYFFDSLQNAYIRHLWIKNIASRWTNRAALRKWQTVVRIRFISIVQHHEDKCFEKCYVLVLMTALIS